MAHLNKAIDKVRKQEYASLSGGGRQFIKGQKYALLSRWGNLTHEGRAALKLLFHAKKRLYKAYLLKESFTSYGTTIVPLGPDAFLTNGAMTCAGSG